ncbi:bifunctional adenosylcobinamide kinase/adenosylcobinamide-phosphate guanylyltransferase, partial [Paenibacillus polymyxa]
MKALVTGGARSGKSGFAERLCMSRAPGACYIATAQAYDMEMKERIALHRVQRESAGYDWQ